MSRLVWRRSRFCNGASACVEVAPLPDGSIGVRDSKLGSASPILRVPAADWQAFVEAIAFRSRGDVGLVTLSKEVDRLRADVWVLAYEGDVLRFTDSEVAAFVAGVKDGEFEPDALSAGDDAGVDGLGRPPASTERDGEASPVPA